MVDRDLATIADVTDRAGLARLLRAIGATSSAELNVDALSSSLGMPATTIRRHIADSGLLAYLVGANERRIDTDLDIGGMCFETFVRQPSRSAIASRRFRSPDSGPREGR